MRVLSAQNRLKPLERGVDWRTTGARSRAKGDEIETGKTQPAGHLRGGVSAMCVIAASPSPGEEIGVFNTGRLTECHFGMVAQRSTVFRDR